MNVEAELNKISSKHNGLLRPIDVVNFARDETTALHNRFQWDDSKAAEEYRLWQAREIIQVIVNVIGPEESKCRAYVSLSKDRSRAGGGYRPIVKVLSDVDKRNMLLQEALEEFERFREKYGMLQELSAIFAAIEDIKSVA